MSTDPKLMRERKYGTKADKWRVEVEPASKLPSRCRMCRCKFWPGEARLKIFNATMHRQCLKEWLEASYLQVPPQPDERERTLYGPPDVVDEFRLEREFQAYRQVLLDRLSSSSPDCKPAGQPFEDEPA